MTGIDWSALYPTPVRVALLKAIRDEPGRIYGEAGETWDKSTGGKVSARMADFIGAQWAEAIPRAGYRQDWSPQRTYFRLTDLGEAAIERGRR